MAKTKVKITKDTNDRRKCHPDPVNLQTVTGDEVTFEFKDEPNASITFKNNNSPFNEPVVLDKPMRIRDGAAGKHFDYTIVWPGGGTGAASGDVGPSR